MKRHFLPLNALRAFEATARLKSFQKAADELNVTHSAVSHQIKKLEQQLGQLLFQRLGRTIALTDIGQLYFVEIHAALNQIERSTLALFGEPDEGELIVQAYMGIAARWLVPRLGLFRQQYPNIQIELYNSYLAWDFEPDKADIGLIYSEEIRNGLVYQQLFKGSLIAVCSPTLFDQTEISATELIQAPFLPIRESPRNLPAWLTSLGLSENAVTTGHSQDNHLLALEAAIAGQGIAIVQSWFASADLASGRLVMPINHRIPELGAWYLVQSAQRLADSKVTCFGNWLHHQLAAEEFLIRSS